MCLKIGKQVWRTRRLMGFEGGLNVRLDRLKSCKTGWNQLESIGYYRLNHVSVRLGWKRFETFLLNYLEIFWNMLKSVQICWNKVKKVETFLLNYIEIFWNMSKSVKKSWNTPIELSWHILKYVEISSNIGWKQSNRVK